MSTLVENNKIVESVDKKKWEDYDTILCPDGQVIDMQKLLDDQEKAKAALTHIQPFFGEFISMLRPVYTFRIQTQATDGKNLLINPQFTANLDFTEKVFVLAHEIMHCVLNHMRRAKALGLSADKANVAADYECNITLSKENKDHCMGLVGIPVMTKLGAIVDKKYMGWGFEKIYNDCKDSYNETQENKEGQQSEPAQQKADADYIKGWNQAIEDYKNGKLKL